MNLLLNHKIYNVESKYEGKPKINNVIKNQKKQKIQEKIKRK